MFPRLVLILLVSCMACHSGLIPCPKPTYAKMKRTYLRKQGNDEYYAKAEEESQTNRKTRSPRADHMVNSISMEEWDCPHPGEKKYMPRHVKQNIRKNFRRMNGDKKQAADSLRLK